ncbi:MAG: sulfite exporter TauE/SafE family protein [Nocardioidaceae bacterium]|nr:sulfite exporter TauE/SafE family protein [Nocardioidaceae bacterium]
MLGISVSVLAVLAVTVLVGSAVQGLVGLGVGLVAAPVTALLAPELMPGLLLWLAAALPLVTLLRDHHDIDWRGLGWSVPGRVPGTVLGVAVVAWFSDRQLGVAVGLMVLVAVVLTFKTVRLPVNKVTLVAAGFVSGVTGTATSIGGPPMALLYQHREPRQIRSTLAVYFVFGAALSLIGLAVAGSLEVRELLLSLLLAPCLVVGSVVSVVLRRRLDPGTIRYGVLAVCGLSALVLLVRSVTG